MILGISLIGTALFLTLLCVILRHFKKEFFPKKLQKNPVYSFFFGISAFLYEKFLILKPDALLVLKEKLRSTHSNENADELAYSDCPKCHYRYNNRQLKPYEYK